LFDAIGVKRLIAGQTVDEVLVGAEAAAVTKHLKTEIVEELAPFVVAVLLVRADRDHAKLVVRRLTERFEVLSIPKLKVSLVLRSDAKKQVTSDFKHVYLRKSLEPAKGAIEEAHYSLYVALGDRLRSIDGDALGDTLEPIFLDGVGQEMAGLVSRILTRYQHHDGDRAAMETFLLEHLAVTREVQEEARALLSGEDRESGVNPPPPALVVTPVIDRQSGEASDLGAVLTEHQESLQADAREFVDDLLREGVPDGKRPTEGRGGIGGGPRRAAARVTPEQQRRGLRGEEEIRRRLLIPGGWEGFIFVADHRDPPRGYDFLASLGSESVKLEVKTFTLDGQAVVTEGELRQAAQSRSAYWLVGVIDDGGPPPSWRTILVQDPLMRLLREGRFAASFELHVSAEALVHMAQRRSTADEL